MQLYDVIVIGGGQSALACGYYLRRSKLNYLLLDQQEQCGGAWQHAWDSLTLFSPAEQSSLPGWWMPKSDQPFPTKPEVVDYLCRYEARYKIPVERPVRVERVQWDGAIFSLQTTKGNYRCRALISATGTWHKPHIPALPGRDLYQGLQLHSAQYHAPKDFEGQRVLIVGEGNSGAQILAEISQVAAASWAVRREPEFLPDDVDGRVLFNQASAKFHAEQQGETFDRSKLSLGNIVMVPSVKAARGRGALTATGQIAALYKTGVVWANGERERFDAIIWCTGFDYATDHLRELAPLDERGRLSTEGTRATDVPGLWLVGYGGWTGFASATVIGVGRSARQTVKEIITYLKTSV